MLSFRNLRLSALAAIATAALMLFIVQIFRNARPAPAAPGPPPQTDARQAEALTRQVESLRSIVEQMKAEMALHQQQQETAVSNTATTMAATKNLENGLPE